MKIELENCQKSLTLKDFEEIESKLGYALPERLKEFYLQYNGGEPKQQTISINKYYEVEIRIFQPFKYNKSFKNALFILLKEKPWSIVVLIRFLTIFCYLPVDITI